MPGGHQDDDLVDLRRVLEDRDGVLEDGLTGDLHQLLGNAQAQAFAGTSGEDDGDGAGRPPRGRVGQSRLRRHAQDPQLLDGEPCGNSTFPSGDAGMVYAC
jgi:hypothetical protein